MAGHANSLLRQACLGMPLDQIMCPGVSSGQVGWWKYRSLPNVGAGELRVVLGPLTCGVMQCMSTSRLDL